MTPAFKKAFLIAVIGLFIFSGNAFAKMLNGKVVSTDASTRKLTLSMMDAVSGETVNADIWVNADAGLQGFGALTDLKKGDNVWVEAESDSEGNLRAAKISKG